MVFVTDYPLLLQIQREGTHIINVRSPNKIQATTLLSCEVKISKQQKLLTSGSMLLKISGTSKNGSFSTSAKVKLNKVRAEVLLDNGTSFILSLD